ncbi:MAG: hypothetical protein OER88_06855 [Planctomycetota bacterium]|nr:hypothetical protein [Planctomycetota bacterium]
MTRPSRTLLLAAGAVALLAPLLIATVVWEVRNREARKLVRRAATAHQDVDYRGEIAWTNDDNDDGDGSVVHEAATGATYYRMGRWRYVRLGPSTRMPDPAAWCLDLEALSESYRASEDEPGTFLQRPVRWLVLEPRHDGRPRIRVAVDVGTGLPLQVTSYAPDGSVAYQASFQSVSFEPQRVKRTVSGWWVKWRGNVVSEAEFKAAAPQRLEPAHMPAGFRCIERRIRGWETVYSTRVYSDGATAFEIEQSAVGTPEQMLAALTKKLGPARARDTLEQILEYRRRSAPPTAPAGTDAVVTRKSIGRHTTYRLEVDGRSVTLTARSDFDAEEVTNVLRSLRTP